MIHPQKARLSLNVRSDNLLFEELSVDEASRRAGIKPNNGGIFLKKVVLLIPRLCAKF